MAAMIFSKLITSRNIIIIIPFFSKLSIEKKNIVILGDGKSRSSSIMALQSNVRLFNSGCFKENLSWDLEHYNK